MEWQWEQSTRKSTTITLAWPLPGKSVTMLVWEISEKGVKFLQNPRTEKPEKGVIFQYILKSSKRGALKCCSGNRINGYFSEKRAFLILIISGKRVPQERSMLTLLTRSGHAGI